MNINNKKKRKKNVRLMANNFPKMLVNCKYKDISILFQESAELYGSAAKNNYFPMEKARRILKTIKQTIK